MHYRDSVLGIATGYGLDDRGIDSREPLVLVIYTETDRTEDASFIVARSLVARETCTQSCSLAAAVLM
jgi:hypothetical protein